MSQYSDFFPSTAASGGSGTTINGNTWYGQTTPAAMPRQMMNGPSRTNAQDIFGDSFYAENWGTGPNSNYQTIGILSTTATTTVANYTAGPNGFAFTGLILSNYGAPAATVAADIDIIVDGTTHSFTGQPVTFGGNTGGCFVMGYFTVVHDPTVGNGILRNRYTNAQRASVSNNPVYGSPPTYGQLNANIYDASMPSGPDALMAGLPWVLANSTFVIQVTVNDVSGGGLKAITIGTDIW